MQKIDICEFCADKLKSAYTVRRVGDTKTKACAQCGRKIMLGCYELTKKEVGEK